MKKNKTTIAILLNGTILFIGTVSGDDEIKTFIGRNLLRPFIPSNEGILFYNEKEIYDDITQYVIKEIIKENRKVYDNFDIITEHNVSVTFSDYDANSLTIYNIEKVSEYIDCKISIKKND